MDSPRRPVRVAVVGTGLAGLATAYFLATAEATARDGQPLEFEVHLVDRSKDIGMDTASLSVKTDEDDSFRVDVPMRSINGGNRVRKLYQHLGVPLIRSDFSYSFSHLASLPAAPATPTLDSSSLRSRRARDSGYASPARASDGLSKTAPFDASPARPAQQTAFLYEGASGLRWPPVSLPSQVLRAGGLVDQLVHAAQIALLAISYLYLLALAFLYVSLGLARPTSARRKHCSPSSIPASWLSRLVSGAWTQSGVDSLLNVASVPLGAFCRRHRVPQRFVESVLTPLMAAVATVGVEDAREMPTGQVLDYIVDTFAHPHYVTCPSVGVRGIVRKLVAPIPLAQIHLGVEISRLEALGTGAGADGDEDGMYRLKYHSLDSTSGATTERGAEKSLVVDHVVFATQANQAAYLLETLAVPGDGGSASRDLDETLAALRAFEYVRTLVVTHRDESVLPRDRRDRRDLNLAVFQSALEGRERARGRSRRGGAPGDGLVEKEEEEEEEEWDESLDYLPPSSVQTTHILSSETAASSVPTTNSSSIDDTPALFQTTNPLVRIDPDLTLASTWFSRAFVTAKSQAVLDRFLLPPSTTAGPLTPDRSLQGQALGHACGPSTREKPSAAAPPRTAALGPGTAGGIWFAGSYAETGIPLLEGCVSSAERAVRGIVQGAGGRVESWVY
ncbi:hypothetical protein JCM8202v2_002743 [Rhodotorula sphaerocarpa]